MKLLAGVFWTTAILVFGVGSCFGSQTGARLSSEFDGFPLWRDVPGRTFAKLHEAKLPNGTRWAAYASRVGAGGRGRENPCLTVASITAYGVYGVVHGCGPLAPDGKGDPPVKPMMTSVTFKGAKPVESETFLAMSFKTSIASILITPMRGEPIRKRTHLLNDFQRRKTHLPPLRYVALGLEGEREFCIANLVGYHADGKVAFEDPYEECEPTVPMSESE